MTILYIDPVAGCSGDMTISALIDAGCPFRVLRDMLDQLPIELPTLSPEKRKKGALEGTYLNMGKSGLHLSIRQMQELTQGLKVEERVTRDALGILAVLVNAEARVHGVEPDEVHFHELAHVDTLIDILCVAKAISYFNVESVYCGPIPQGRGFIKTSHGILPNPPPVTVEILKGMKLVFYDQDLELTTPTGAAILKYYARQSGHHVPFGLKASGVGFGTYETESPNVVRVFVGEAGGGPDEEVWVIETDMDDMAVEYMGAAADRIRQAGALDVLYHPVHMKKGRLGLRLFVVAAQATLERVIETLLKETSTFGLRLRKEERRVLKRKEVLCKTSLGTVRVKEGYDSSGALLKRHIEFEDVRKIGDEKGMPYRQVLELLEKEL